MLINKTVVLDASVVIKWYHEEEDTEIAEAIERRIKDGELRAIAPSLLFYEVANGLLFKPNSEPDAVIATLRQLRSLSHFQIYEIAPKLLDAAAIIAKQYRLSVYDAMYVAMAVDMHAPLITADKKLAQALNSPLITLLGASEI